MGQEDMGIWGLGCRAEYRDMGCGVGCGEDIGIWGVGWGGGGDVGGVEWDVGQEDIGIWGCGVGGISGYGGWDGVGGEMWGVWGGI